TPGSVMTYFPFPDIAPGKPGAGEVGVTDFAVPKGAADFWIERLAEHGAEGLEVDEAFGARRVCFNGPDGDGFSLTEIEGDTRAPWTGTDVPEEMAIRGFSGARLRLQDAGATAELLTFMGYEQVAQENGVTRFRVADGDAADVIDIEASASLPRARPGAGSVHHIAFAVENRAAQLRVRKAIEDTGYMVTPVIDRDYFWAIYFRTPGGVLFEVATNEPGFDRDEPKDRLGQDLMLPSQHEHLRASLEAQLQPISN
ncbi:MAG: ring-cleaving dioxygenase, partial [Planctomycetota bacterium]